MYHWLHRVYVCVCEGCPLGNNTEPKGGKLILMGFASLLAPSPIRTETDLYSLSSLLSLQTIPWLSPCLEFPDSSRGFISTSGFWPACWSLHFILDFLWTVNYSASWRVLGTCSVEEVRSSRMPSSCLDRTFPAVAQNANNVHIFSALFKNPFCKISRNVLRVQSHRKGVKGKFTHVLLPFPRKTPVLLVSWKKMGCIWNVPLTTDWCSELLCPTEKIF